MPRSLASYSLTQIANLESSPTALSRPSKYPLPGQGQIYSFDYTVAGVVYVVIVHFRYGADEQRLHIGSIVWFESMNLWT
jgi:hypothetical protein